MLSRPLNVGFSGGEKKRNEILQMSLLEPSFIIMDETDSGLDIDALKIVSNGVNTLRNQDRSFLIITHYQRLLNYIKPDFVHVLSDGKIVKTGDWKLALELEDEGWKFTCDNFNIGIDNGLYFGNKNSYGQNQNIFISGIINSNNENITWQLNKI